MKEVKIPMNLWEGDEEAVITSWLVDDGSEVMEEELLAEIMVEKTEHEVTSPGAGVVHIHKETDAIVAKGDLIAIIE